MYEKSVKISGINQVFSSMKKVLKLHNLIICFSLFFFMLVTGETYAATYYISPSGSDNNNGAQNSPWATFNHAMTRLQPGDTLILKDGTYYQSLNVTVSGTQGNPITIKAENDGQVVVDGETIRNACNVKGTTLVHKSDIVIEGIICQNSNKDAFEIDYADRITLRRVSAYNGSYNLKRSVFQVYKSTYITIEDCIATGWGRNMYLITESRYVTIRRSFGMWKGWKDAGLMAGDNWIVQLYGTSDSIVENVVGVRHPNAMNVGHAGINVWNNDWNNDASRNRIYGNIIKGMTSWAYWDASKNHRIEDNKFINNVAIGNAYGLNQRGDANMLVDQMTWVNTTNSVFALSEFPYSPKDTDYEIYGNIKNSVLLGGATGFNINNSNTVKGFDHSYNDLSNLINNYIGTSAGLNEIYIQPSYDTNKYGKGAYLIRPSNLKGLGENGADIGAEVLYRYENGVLTSVPLWPWPMEDRICSETGFSVTYEDAGNGCTGGLWKTLEGVYSGNQYSFDFSLSNSGNASIAQGLSASNTITSSLVAGSAQSVSFSVSGLPPGATAAFSQASCSPDCSTTLTINTLTSTPPGTYTIAVTGTGGGITRTTSFNLAVNSSSSSQNTIISARTLAPITIDGDLSEPVWNQANYVTFANPSRSDNQVKVYTLYDANNLYFAYEVIDSSLEAQNVSLWADDGVEIYLDTQNNKSTSMDQNDYHFTTNINNQTSGETVTVKTKTNTNGYTQEIAIPWATINVSPSSNKTMGLLLGNNDRDNGQSSQFDWLNLIETGSYARPNLWGQMSLSSQTVGTSSDTIPPSPPSGIIWNVH